MLPSACAAHRVLIVDDNDDAAASLSLLLSIKGYEVRVANDGHEAIAAAASAWQPSVIFLDITLPDLDGFEVARLLRRAHGPSAFRLIGLSGVDHDADCEQVRDAGFDDFLRKPADLDDLLRAMKST